MTIWEVPSECNLVQPQPGPGSSLASFILFQQATDTEYSFKMKVREDFTITEMALLGPFPGLQRYGW